MPSAAFLALCCAACQAKPEHRTSAPVIVVAGGERAAWQGGSPARAVAATGAAASLPATPAGENDPPEILVQQTAAREADLDRIDQVDPAELQAAARATSDGVAG